MDTTDAEAKSIIDEFHTAFRGVPKGPLSLHQAMVKTWTDDERVTEAGSLDADRHWEEIPDHDIEHGAKALYGADPESWRYFIPAFVVWSLRYFKVNDAFTSDQTIYAFDPCGDKSYHTDKMERFRTLSRVQSHAVCRFLRYMLKHDDFADSKFARKAIDEYWGQFCAE